MSIFAQGPRDRQDADLPASELCLRAMQRLASSDRELRLVLARLAKPSGLTETQILVLYGCATSDPQCGASQSELAELAGVSPAQISETVDRLRRREWIVGDRSPRDRRRQVWRLTGAGQRCLQGLLSDLEAWAQSLQSRLEPDDLPALSEALRQLIVAARQTNVAHASRVPVESNSQKGAA